MFSFVAEDVDGSGSVGFGNTSQQSQNSSVGGLGSSSQTVIEKKNPGGGFRDSSFCEEHKNPSWVCVYTLCVTRPMILALISLDSLLRIFAHSLIFSYHGWSGEALAWREVHVECQVVEHYPFGLFSFLWTCGYYTGESARKFLLHSKLCCQYRYLTGPSVYFVSTFAFG